ncbi:hypothetical protein C6B37_00900 [Candidatus Phytoplasma phoenicium]|uniref:Uncharacterized protein n=1 Tax=Candidatus Phytoplasma phoenicium TaxID=198422 RepID=A0A2S8NV08_9MOLU|nr:hypothetical protein C6B37_00900 [Candidatus Phytoplasma phoenicium]
MKKVSSLVKMGCLICLIILIPVSIQRLILLKSLINEGFNDFNDFDFYLQAILSFLPIYLYIRVFQGKASNLVRILLGILGLLFLLIPGLFILSGEYGEYEN